MVDAAGGGGVEGVELTLQTGYAFAERSRLAFAGKELPAVAAAASGRDGRFVLQAPGHGLWRLLARRDGYLPAFYSLQPLYADEELPDLRLVREVERTVRVVDAEGRPLAGARLVAAVWMPGWSSREGWWLESTARVTGDDGLARVPAHPEARLLLVARHGDRYGRTETAAGTSPATLRLDRALVPSRVVTAEGRPAKGAYAFLLNPFLPLGRVADDGTLLLPPPGDDLPPLLFADDEGILPLAERGVTVAPGEPPQWQLAATTAFDGRVIDAGDGSGIAGALVWGASAYAVCDRTGSFRLRIRSDGVISVQAAAAGYIPASTQLKAPVEEREIPLEPALTVEGRVLDGAGQGVAGAEITAQALPRSTFNPDGSSVRMMISSPPRASRRRTSAGPDGRFRLTALAYGVPYALAVRAPGFAPAAVSLAETPAGESPPPLSITLEPGLVATGRVVDFDHQPVAGAGVMLLASPVPDSGPPPAQATSDEGGSFELRDLAPGLYSLTVRAEGFVPATVPGIELERSSEAIDLGSVQLDAGATVRGKVTDVEGRPLEGVELSLFGKHQGGLALRTDSRADGSFRFTGVPRHVQRLWARREGFVQREMSIDPAVEEEVRVVLEPGITLTGRVIDARGEPVPGAPVNVKRWQHGGLIGRSVRCDEEGRFVAPDLAPGRVILEVAGLVGKGGPVSVELSPDRPPPEVVIELKPTATLQGRIVDLEGRPVSEAGVAISRLDPSTRGPSGMSTHAASDQAGGFVFFGQEPGEYVVRVSHPQYEPAERRVELTDGGEQNLELVLEPRQDAGPLWHGRLVDEEGRGVDGARVFLRGASGRRVGETRSGSDGAFRLQAPRFEPGVIVVDHPAFAPWRSPLLEPAAAGEPLLITLERGGEIRGEIHGLEPGQLAIVQILATSDGVTRRGVARLDGRYRVAGLAPGEHLLELKLPDRSARERVVIHAPGEVVEHDVELAGGARLSGRVLADGEALAGATLFLSCGEHTAAGTAETTTQGDGFFIFRQVPYGVCRLYVGASQRGLSVEREVIVDADEEEVLIELRTSSVRGRVIDRVDGSPIAGATIRLWSEKGGTPFDARSDGEGFFRLVTFEQVEMSLQVTARGYATLTQRLTLAGEDPSLELALTPAVPLELYLRREDGEVPRWVDLQATAGDRSLSTLLQPTADGRAVVEILSPGRWRLELQDRGSGDRASLELTLPAPPQQVVLRPPADDQGTR
ncbi:MAG: carboxypeptidase regulatory-like domain-containing protein [Acidobacteria bacterium]|nr:MAG: carboxypeptidase regulatory-like domain-containing protein [Acidobacteriota bacterium]